MREGELSRASAAGVREAQRSGVEGHLYVQTGERIHMAASTIKLRDRSAWQALQAHYNHLHNRHLRTLFAEDPQRGETMNVEGLLNLVV